MRDGSGELTRPRLNGRRPRPRDDHRFTGARPGRGDRCPNRREGLVAGYAELKRRAERNREADAAGDRDDLLLVAYALYDLGGAVRLSGEPQAAVPILERRLQIDNQRWIVDAELHLVRQGVG